MIILKCTVTDIVIVLTKFIIVPHLCTSMLKNSSNERSTLFFDVTLLWFDDFFYNHMYAKPISNIIVKFVKTTTVTDNTNIDSNTGCCWHFFLNFFSSYYYHHFFFFYYLSSEEKRQRHDKFEAFIKKKATFVE
jgi:hypothetical protein